MKNTLKRYWPYDEVSIQIDPHQESQLTFSAPWLKVQMTVDQSQIPKIQDILSKLTDQKITPADLDDINWLMTVVAKYPFAYILPRAENLGTDQHDLSASLSLRDPKSALQELLNTTSSDAEINTVLQHLSDQWTWDVDAALELSRSAQGHDVFSLFSVARRFHLLNDLENNKTAEMFQLMSSFSKDSPKFRAGSALIMRQNHHITIKCEQALKSALPLAQSAEEAIFDFVQAESGHHQIIEKGINHLGFRSDEIEVLGCVRILMELFEKIGKTNLLAFAMTVDVFERSSYQKEDPFAELLEKGGEGRAAKQMEIHRDINDAGEHENVALSFLESAQAVNQPYAVQALRLAELLTQVIHQISSETIQKIKQMTS